MDTLDPQAHLTSPAEVASAIKSLLNDTGDNVIIDQQEARDLAARMNTPSSASAVLSEFKGPFTPKGEGKSGNPSVNLWSSYTVGSSSKMELTPDPPLSEATMLETQTQTLPPDWEDDETQSNPDGETHGDTDGFAGPEGHQATEAENQPHVTQEELDDFIAGLEEFIPKAVDEALAPLKASVAELSTRVAALLGSQSALQIKVSNVVQQVARLKEEPPLTKILPQGSGALTAPQPAGHSRHPSVSDIPNPVGPAAIVREFLRANPSYPERGILRRGKLARLASLVGHKTPKGDVPMADWNEDGLLRALSPEP